MDRTIAPKVSTGLVDFDNAEIKALIDRITPEKDSLNEHNKLYIFRNPKMELVRIDLLFDAGIIYQTKPLVATMTLDLLKSGTESHSAADIANTIDYYGAILETRVDMERATITLFSLTQHVEKVLPIVKDIILNPLFAENEINIKRDQMLQKFRVNEQKTSFVAKRNFNNLLLGNNHPLGVLTTESDYHSVNRDELTAFFSTHYRGFDIVMAGNITEELISTVKNTFAFAGSKVTPPVPIVSSSLKHEKYVEKPKSLHSTVAMGNMTIPANHPDYTLLTILTTILGGYFGSRLMSNIREDKGYTYGIGARILSLKNNSIFSISSDVDINATKEVVDEIKKEIEILRNELISEAELNTVINYISGQILRCIDGTFPITDNFIAYLGLGLNLDTIAIQIEIMKQVTPQMLMDTARKYYNFEDIYTSIVGKNIDNICVGI